MASPGPDSAFTLITLKKRSEFLRLNGKSKWITPSFIMLMHTQQTPDVPRFGFTATKKLGGAVVRNRAKRRLREAVRAVAGQHAKPGHDYVLIARDSALQCSHEALLRDLQTALARIHRPARVKSEAAPPETQPKHA